MQISKLREFIVLASCLNFNTAANKLYVSQPSLSNHIADIERELGVKLFERKPNVSLTPQGKIFYEDAANIVERYEASLKRIAQSKGGLSGQITVKSALVSATESTKLTEILLLFTKANPQVSIKMIEGNEISLFDGMKQGAIDCATIPGSKLLPESIEDKYPVTLVPLFKGQCYVWAKKGHPILQGESVQIKDVVAYPYPLPLGQVFDEWELGITSLFATEGQAPLYYRRYAESFDDFILSIRDDDVLVWGKSVMSVYHDIDCRPIAGLDVYLYAAVRNAPDLEVLEALSSFIKHYSLEQEWALS
jgi:DNA-binding transcriptional LysR family regulator